jgi:hypothetical protein
MLLEHGDCAFSHINTVIVQWDLYIYFVGANIFFDSLGTLVVHHVQCGLIVARAEDGKYLREGGDEQGVGAAWHGSHDDGVDVVDIHHKNILLFSNNWTGKAPVRLVYMVPVFAPVRAEKQNMSCIPQASCIGDI